MLFDQKSLVSQEVYGSLRKGQTDKHMEIATYWLNRLRGQLSENMDKHRHKYILGNTGYCWQNVYKISV